MERPVPIRPPGVISPGRPTTRRWGNPITQHQVARLLKRFNVRPDKVKIAGKELLPPRRPGTGLEPAHDSATGSTVSGRNPHSNGSDLKTAVSPMNTVTVPRFRSENLSVQR